MKLLVYGNRKQDDDIWDISTPEKHAQAFLELFKILRDDWQVYCDVDTKEQGLLVAANEGDAKAAETLLTRRKRHEYEEWHFDETKN